MPESKQSLKTIAKRCRACGELIQGCLDLKDPATLKAFREDPEIVDQMMELHCLAKHPIRKLSDLLDLPAFRELKARNKD